MRRPSRTGRVLVRALPFAVLTMCGTLVFCTRGFYVYGSCMEPSLTTGERVLANRFAYWFGGPRRGDVVIFRYPRDPSKNYVKRVVGLPGDTVEIRHGRVIVNGRLLEEPYRVRTAHGNFGPRRVRQGNLFVLGDNLDQSNDSRFWGELPIENLEAKALLGYWPPSRWHFLN